MTLALVVRGPAQAGWDRTFAATAGPHVVVTTYTSTAATARAAAALAAAPEVRDRAGPYPLLSLPDGALRAGGTAARVEVMGRDAAPAAVDRPAVRAGGWVRAGGVVMEESFAAALGVRAGDRITIAGRPYDVAGVAASAFRQPTPFYSDGLVWATRADAAALAGAAESSGSVLMLRLADPAAAAGFAAAHGTDAEPYVDDRLSTRYDALTDVLFAQFGLIVGAVSLALLAAASVAVAVAGRMAAQARRAALLKAVGATPRFVAAVAFGELLVLALAAGAAGLAAGALLAAPLGRPVPGILGGGAATVPSGRTVALVLGCAVALVALSTVAPIVRSARRGAATALAGPARAPRRSRLAVRISAALPTPALLGLRLAARRPGRALLSAAGLSVTVAAVVVALWMRAGIAGDAGTGALAYDKLRLVTYLFIGALVALALVNAVLVAGTTAQDNATNAALVRALGATPRQVAAGLTIAGVLPALAAVAAGVPLGFLVFRAAAAAAGTADRNPTPDAIGLIALLPATLAAVAAADRDPEPRGRPPPGSSRRCTPTDGRRRRVRPGAAHSSFNRATMLSAADEVPGAGCGSTAAPGSTDAHLDACGVGCHSRVNSLRPS